MPKNTTKKTTRKPNPRDVEIFVMRMPESVKAACAAEAEAAGLRSAGAFVRQCIGRALVKKGYELADETAKALHI